MNLLVKQLASVLWLAVIWVVLWGQLDARSAVGGLAVGALLVFGMPEQRRIPFHALRPVWITWAILRYGWMVLTANAQVAWEVMTPGSKVREGIVAVRIVGQSDAVISALAHAISGTPGTLIVDVDQSNGTILYVHFLHLRSVEEARVEILELERMLIKAIGSDGSLEASDELLTHHRNLVASQSGKAAQ